MQMFDLDIISFLVQTLSDSNTKSTDTEPIEYSYEQIHVRVYPANDAPVLSVPGM